MIRADGHGAAVSMHSSISSIDGFFAFSTMRSAMLMIWCMYLHFTAMLRNLPIRYLQMLSNRHSMCIFYFCCDCLSFHYIFKSIINRMNDAWKRESQERMTTLRFSHAAFRVANEWTPFFLLSFYGFHALKLAQNAKRILLVSGYRSSTYIIARMILRICNGRTHFRSRKVRHKFRMVFFCRNGR